MALQKLSLYTGLLQYIQYHYGQVLLCNENTKTPKTLCLLTLTTKISFINKLILKQIIIENLNFHYLHRKRDGTKKIIVIHKFIVTDNIMMDRFYCVDNPSF